MNLPTVPIDKVPAGEVTIPGSDPDWHPVARRWFDSLAKSGQSVFYVQSDWETAYLVAESISRDLQPKFVAMDPEDGPIVRSMPLSGSSLTAYLRSFAALLVTEGDRRRASVELQSGAAGDDGEEVSSLDDLRRRLGSTG